MHSRRSAFTLVELSIVLVIVGLVVGGILGGQSLIQAHKVRNVLTDAKTYAIAMQQFKDKYDYFPGDFPTATNVWGSDAAACSTGNNLTPGTCNGNGNGYIDWCTAAGATCEGAEVWRQLSAAGIIIGKYTGLSGAGGVNHVVPGVNAPLGPLQNTTFFHIGSWGIKTGDANYFPGNYDNAMYFGASVANDWNYGAALTGKEAFEIDTKGDDGLPAYGGIRLDPSALSCVSSSTPSAAIYIRSSGSTLICGLYFTNTFMAPQQ